MTDRPEPEVVHHHSLVPPHRRARVIFALAFFSLSLFFLTYVGTAPPQ